MEINSVFTVTEYKTKKQYTETIRGSGQDAIRFLRKEYPRFSRFVLEGFEIEGNFVPLKIR